MRTASISTCLLAFQILMEERNVVRAAVILDLGQTASA